MAKRTTADEKQKTMLSIFTAKRDIFVIKEIEKLAAKKGINSQKIKETLQSLLDDNLVISEKVGISNYFWANLKDEGREALEKRDQLLQDKKSMEACMKSANLRLINEKAGREDSPARNELKQMLDSLKAMLERQREEMTVYAECDPRVYKERLEGVDKMKEEINKTTDDIFVLQGYVCEKFGMERSEFNRNFNIDDEMDSI